MKTSDLEETFSGVLRMYGPLIPAPVREFAYAPPRRFRADFAWPQYGVLLECEGGVWSGGAHGRGTGIEKDCDRANHAAANGFRVIRVTRKALDEDPVALVIHVQNALLSGGWKPVAKSLHRE